MNWNNLHPYHQIYSVGWQRNMLYLSYKTCPTKWSVFENQGIDWGKTLRRLRGEWHNTHQPPQKTAFKNVSNAKDTVTADARQKSLEAGSLFKESEPNHGEKLHLCKDNE